jgi:hypothetical protein
MNRAVWQISGGPAAVGLVASDYLYGDRFRARGLGELRTAETTGG